MKDWALCHFRSSYLISATNKQLCICMHFCFIKSNANQGGMMLYCIKAVTYICTYTHKSCHAIWKHAKLILRGSRHRHRINHSLKGVFPLGNKYNCNINELISLMNSSRCINCTSAFFTSVTN